MKNYTKLVAFAMLCVLAGCTADNNLLNQNENSALTLEGSFTDDWLGNFEIKTDTIFLFEVQKEHEFDVQLSKYLAMFDEEIRDLKANYDDVDLITYKLKLVNNQAYITDLYFLDGVNKTVLEDFKNTGHQQLAFWDDLGLLLEGSCVLNWQHVGSYTPTVSTLDGSTAVFGSGFKPVGNCFEMQYARSMKALQVCTRAC